MDKHIEKAIKEHAMRFAEGDRDWTCREATDHTRDLVTQLGLGHEEIGALLEAMFERVKVLGFNAGKIAGAKEERDTNPANKSVGEAVGVAVKYHVNAVRETVAAVFNAECGRMMNPHYAFNQAMKAIEKL